MSDAKMDPSSDGGPQPSETPPLQPEGKPPGVAETAPWVRYRLEHRDATTNDVLFEKESRNDDQAVEGHGSIDEPVFEVVTRYKSRKGVGKMDDTADPPVVGVSYKKHLNLYSPAIINALQLVVEYYPSQNLTGNPITVDYPYAVLAHHYDELKAFGEACEAKAPGDLCAREVHACAHLTVLLKFLDDNIMDDVRLEQKRNKEGGVTWELLWVSYKPGATIVGRLQGHEGSEARVVHSVEGGIFSDPPEPWCVRTWVLGFRRTRVGRVARHFVINKFDGESRDLSGNEKVVYPSTRHFLEASNNETLPQHVRDKAEYGKLWWQLRRKQCKNYRGRSQTYPHNEVRSVRHAFMLKSAS